MTSFTGVTIKAWPIDSVLRVAVLHFFRLGRLKGNYNMATEHKVKLYENGTQISLVFI